MSVHTLPGVKLPKEEGLRYIEPAPISEYFCSDRARVFVHGQFARLVFTTEEIPGEMGDGECQNVSVCKIVLPVAALPALNELIGKHLPAVPEGGAG